MQRDGKTGKLIAILLIFAAFIIVLVFSILGSKIPIKSGGFGDFVTSTLFDENVGKETECESEYSIEYS